MGSLGHGGATTGVMPPAVLRILAVLVASTSVAACGGADDNDGGSLTVFAASSLSEVADSLAGAFTDSSPEIDHMEVQSGGSDSLARLIVDGAPADALLTADLSTMDLLADLPVDPVVVANNRAALVVPEDNPAGIESVTDLADPTVILAACEPVVPCGDAASGAVRAGRHPTRTRPGHPRAQRAVGAHQGRAGRG